MISARIKERVVFITHDKTQLMNWSVFFWFRGYWVNYDQILLRIRWCKGIKNGYCVSPRVLDITSRYQVSGVVVARPVQIDDKNIRIYDHVIVTARTK